MPGIASGLRNRLKEIRTLQKDWIAVATMQTEEFVRYPSQESFIACKKASSKTKTWSRVREHLLFYLEKGEDVDFHISGNSLIHESQVPNGDEDESESVISDRFSFVAKKSQGDTYTLTFLNNASEGQDKIKVFLEVIYPDKASLFVPIANK